MKGHTPGAWKYFWNAEVCTRDLETREADARLIASAPEMRVALIAAVEALRATEEFMHGQGLETDNLNGIIRVIDELLDKVEQEG